MNGIVSAARDMARFDLSNLRGDIMGGVTAGIVALPLALAFGVASGVGPIAGIYGAIAVGFFASLFGGTGPQISGPTGPMIVVFAGVFASLSGQPELIFGTVVLAGLIQIALGAFGVGDYIRLVPYPVVSGFMSGIGAIIIILQVGRLVGHETPAGTVANLLYVPEALTDPNVAALILGVVSLITVYTWPKKFGKYLPGPLAALLIGTGLSFVITGAPILGDIPSGLPSIIIPSFEANMAFVMVEAAVVLALLGAIDSLLTSLVADNMSRTRHHSNRELFGQGIGNTIAGFIGGIPGAGATMRTVVNIRAGGLTRIAGMVHSLLLLAVVLGLGPLASQIPHAVLAGILVKVGTDIIDWSYIKRAHKGPRWDLLLMALVLGLTVFVDLITAVGAGVALAALAYVRQVAHVQVERLQKLPHHISSDEERALMEKAHGKVLLFSFAGPLSFGAAADLGHHVRERSTDHSEAIILDFSGLPFVDVSAARAVATIAEDAVDSGKRIFICGMPPEVKDIMDGLSALDKVPENHQVDTVVEALRIAVDELEDIERSCALAAE